MNNKPTPELTKGLQDIGNGKWRIYMTAHYDHRGKQKRKCVTVEAGNRKEAKDLRKTLQAQFLEETKSSSTGAMLLRDFARDFCDNECRHNRQLDEKTVQEYTDKFRNHIEPFLGMLRIDEITPPIVHTFLTDLRKPGHRLGGKPEFRRKPLSDTTVHHCYRLLYNIMEHAVALSLIDVNPVKRPKALKLPVQPLPDFPPTLLHDILTGLNDGETIQYVAVVVVAAASGARMGELLGLTWDKINWSTRELNIHQVSRRLRNKGLVLKPKPKNKSSNRSIKLPAGCMEILRELQDAQTEWAKQLGNQWQNSGRVFTSAIGAPMQPGSLSDWVPAFCNRHGIMRLRFHDLRHFSASLMALLNVPIQNASARLGHARKSTTLDRYIHLFQNSDESISDLLEPLFDMSSRRGFHVPVPGTWSGDGDGI